MSRNTDPLPFFKPSIGRKEIQAARRVLKSGWLTTGPEAMAFEEEFAAHLASGNASPVRTLSVNSATAGLHLALEAAGVGPGDQVAVPTLTFTASAEIIRYLGADPLFIDSLPPSGNMDPRRLEEACRGALKAGKRVRAVIPVHLAGCPCDMAAVRAAAAGTGAVVIEDAAHAFPSRTPEGFAGTLGDIGVFSFYATKTITTGEGGMVATRSAGYEERMKLMRLHGIDRTVWNRYSADAGVRSWEYDIKAPGYKYNMTDLAAAIGREQLKKAEGFLEKRRKIARVYRERLSDIPGLELPADCAGHAWHLFIIHTADPPSRDRLAEYLRTKGIGTSVHFVPLHRMSYWKNRYSLSAADFPAADDMAGRSLSIPLWPGMRHTDIERVTSAVREFFNG